MKGWGILISKTFHWISQSYRHHPGDWGAVAEEVLPKVLVPLALAFMLAVILGILEWLWKSMIGAKDEKSTTKQDGQHRVIHSAPEAQGKTAGAGNRIRAGNTFARALGNIRRTFFRKLPRNLWLFAKDLALGWWGEFIRYASFKGRTTRWKFLVFILIDVAILLCLQDMPLLLAGAGLALPLLAACIRRLNDSCTSPWMVFAVPLLPILLLAPTVESGDALPGPSAWDRVLWNTWRLVKEAFGKWWGGLAKFASFQGKMSRRDFLAYYAMHNIVVFVIACLAECCWFLDWAILLLILPTIAASARRLNDTDISPWFCLLCGVPLISPWVLPVYCLWIVLQLVPSVVAEDDSSTGHPSETSPEVP